MAATSPQEERARAVPSLPLRLPPSRVGAGCAGAVAAILDARRVVPAHFDSRAHFTEGREALVAAFTAADWPTACSRADGPALPLVRAGY
ncbi:hypothetical protein OG500_21900 [Kitasatospora sp. NBC_01250]|uniref:hypothetical protein n=1 Tax=unclassified Kitasatospora TaxID=2633591 RepID=UPI002E12F0A3|nr:MULTISPECIES: hypothetical protein [unclassified Kitasatospora]WSJ72204.1 hypothetical protein OG294_22745 [Kitasatospora sp. NBC_01302]